jgi:multidrug resistance efflux pump
LSTAFTNTTRAIAADSSSRDKFIIIISLLLLLMWGAWFLMANITLYKTSIEGVIKQHGQDIDLGLTVSGKVSAIYTKLGQQLKKGELILSLDNPALVAGLAHNKVLLSQLDAQFKMLGNEQHASTTASQLTLEELQIKLHQLQQNLTYLQEIAEIQANIEDRHKTLVLTQKGAQLEYLEAQKTYQKALIDMQATRTQISEVEFTLQAANAQSEQALAQLLQRRNSLEQQISRVQTNIQQQQLQLAEYDLRAPQDGVMAALTVIKSGQIIQAGQSVGTLLTATDSYVEAQFDPQDALGHLHAGQQARILVKGFAWTQYGSFNAEVTHVHVAKAIQNKKIRVQLAIKGEQPPSLPLLYDAAETVGSRAVETAGSDTVLMIKPKSDPAVH